MSRPVLVTVAAAATVAFGWFGVASGAAQTVTYVATIVLLGALLVWLDRTVWFSDHLRYDNVVHFFGFGVAGVAAWEAIAPRLAGHGRRRRRQG